MPFTYSAAKSKAEHAANECNKYQYDADVVAERGTEIIGAFLMIHISVKKAVHSSI